MLTPGNIASH